MEVTALKNGEAPKCRKDPRIVELADALKSLSEPNRLRIICYLSGGEGCVCDVERELGISQQLASHHLNALKDAGFLNVRKESTSSYYSIDTENLKGINETFYEYIDYRRVKPGKRQSCGC